MREKKRVIYNKKFFAFKKKRAKIKKSIFIKYIDRNERL